jgi:hypothetical protein
MGHLAVMDDSPAKLGFTARGVALGRRETLPGSCDREARGTVWLVRDPAEREEALATAARYAQVGVVTEFLDPERLRAEEPDLRPGLGGGLLVPGDQVLYPPGAARFLLERALGRPWSAGARTWRSGPWTRPGAPGTPPGPALKQGPGTCFPKNRHLIY